MDSAIEITWLGFVAEASGPEMGVDRDRRAVESTIQMRSSCSGSRQRNPRRQRYTKRERSSRASTPTSRPTSCDNLLEPEVAYSLTHARSAIEDADWISGDHRFEGVIVVAGPNVKPFEQPPMLIDMAPTILAALGAPASIEHTGRVLHEVVGSEAKVSRGEAAPAVAIRGMPTGEESSNVTDTEADEMEEHLRGLGYLE